MTYSYVPQGLVDALEWCRRIATVVNSTRNGEINVPALTTDASPNLADDWLSFYDVSLDVARKVHPVDLMAGKQPLDATLTALAAFNTNGILTQTAADTFAGRTITASTGVTISNGDGVAGNPAIAMAISGLTEDTAPDAAADFVATYDDSAATHKKVKPSNLVKFKWGSTTYDLTTASGDQAVTGVGFKPRLLIFIAGINNTTQMSVGGTDGTSQGYTNDRNSVGAGTYGLATNGCIQFNQGSGTTQTAVIASMDTDGFTLTWTKAGSPTGTGIINYIALG